MIAIRQYRSFWLHISGLIGGVAKTLFVRTEEELIKVIASIADREMVFIAVIPSSDTIAPDHNNVREHEIGIVYCLVKVNRNNMNENDLVNVQEKAQNAIKGVKQQLLIQAEDCDKAYHTLCRDIDFSRMHVDPEYNYHGCDGYSLSLQFNTPGF